tara:strand:+ start:1926 stop:2123 length:198 start_codon:yes stop_codon:yes gene_type:complete
MNWDANIQQLFDWLKTCPKEWKFQRTGIFQGCVYIQFMKSNVKPIEKTDEEKLNIARGRSYLNDN